MKMMFPFFLFLFFSHKREREESTALHRTAQHCTCICTCNKLEQNSIKPLENSLMPDHLDSMLIEAGSSKQQQQQDIDLSVREGKGSS